MKKKSFLGVLSVLCVAFVASLTLTGTAQAAEVSGACDGSHTGYTAIDKTYIKTATNSLLTLSSGKYFLSENVAVDMLITGDVTLCLNGKILTGKGAAFNRSVITVDTKGAGGLHLCECQTTTHRYENDGGDYFINDNLSTSAPSFTGGAITGGYSTDAFGGGGISVRENSDLTVIGCTIIGNSAVNGGGIAINSTKAIGAKKISMSGTNVIGNNASKNGGGIYSDYAKLELDKCKIYENNAVSDGGGIYLNNQGVLTAENANGEFTTTLNECEIYDNAAAISNGGGICQVGAKIEMTGGKISKNHASVGGGGLVMHEKTATFTLNSGEISGNSVEYYGGGVQIWGGAFELKGGKISKNTSEQYGGGVSVFYDDTALKITGGEISGNSAESGAGVYMKPDSSKLSMTAGLITLNNASSVGGGIYMEQGEATLSGGKITGNDAKYTGGGISAYGAVKLSGNVEITENTVDKTVGSNIHLALSVLVNQKVSFVALFSGKVGITIPDNVDGTVVTVGYGATNSTGAVTYDNAVVSLVSENGEWKTKNNAVVYVTFINCNLKKQTVIKGMAMKKPADPVKQGNVFVEWTLNDVAFNFDTILNEDITLSAKWEKKSYTITYNSNGGDSIPVVTFYIDSETIKLTKPTKKGYEFIGWYSNAQLTGRSKTAVLSGTSADVVVYAKWSKEEYTIIYNTNGGSAIANGKYSIDTATITLETPTREGFKFIGWYSSGELSGDARTEISLGSTGNVELFAKWEENKAPVTPEKPSGCKSSLGGASIIATISVLAMAVVVMVAKKKD